MLKTTQRLSLILTMTTSKLMLCHLNSFAPDTLFHCCAGLEVRQVPDTWYAGRPAIQEELIRDYRFFYYLEKLNASGLSLEKIDAFISVLHKNGKSALDYPAGRLISNLAYTLACSKEIFYDYLECFSGLPTDKEQKETIVKNLALYRNLLSRPVAKLPEEELALFLEPCVSNKDLIPDKADLAFRMLARQPELLELIRYLSETSYMIRFTIGHYERFSLAPKQILGKLKEIGKWLDSDYMNALIKRWLGNDCPLHDLEVLSVKLKGLSEEELDEVLYARGSYINHIYGNRIGSISLSELTSWQESILIYAITNRKNGFIRLVEQNFETFTDISQYSILFSREFFAGHINLNSLNKDNLLDCMYMTAGDMLFDNLESGREYTFAEIKALYNKPAQYLTLYARLRLPRVDDRLVVIRQLTKQSLLAGVTDSGYIGILADKLSQKPLSAWLKGDFAHIAGLKARDAVSLLIHQDTIAKFIPQMKTRIDASLILRNWKGVLSYDSIDNVKEKLMEIDADWRELVFRMGFSEEFLRHNQQRVIEFLCQNGAEIANTYYNGLMDAGRRESLRRIVKAVLMGDFTKLKYYEDDLRLEIDYHISADQKAAWVQNAELTGKAITVRERDDFLGTMLLGIMPTRTCLYYDDGAHKECLLSNFDSNKKVLYAECDGKIVGRAIIRLTKGKFSDSEPQENAGTTLSFVDLESPEAHAEEQNQPEKERLIIFLEKTYSAGINSASVKQVRDLFLQLVEEKADRMGATLVLSNSYGSVNEESLPADYTRTLFHVYISKSKSGAQYLDSLNGAASVSDEGGYRSNNFYIRNSDLLGQ